MIQKWKEGDAKRRRKRKEQKEIKKHGNFGILVDIYISLLKRNK